MYKLGKIEVSLDQTAHLMGIVSSFIPEPYDYLAIAKEALDLEEIPLKDRIENESKAKTVKEAKKEFNESPGNSVKERMAIRKVIDLMTKEKSLLKFRQKVVDYAVSTVFQPDGFETLYLIRRLAEIM